MTPLEFDRVGRATGYQDPPAFADHGPNLEDPLERAAILLWTFRYETPSGAQAILHHGGAPAADTWREIDVVDRRLYRQRAEVLAEELVRVVEHQPSTDDDERGREPQPADTPGGTVPVDSALLEDSDPLELDPLSPTTKPDDDDVGDSFQPLRSSARPA